MEVRPLEPGLYRHAARVITDALLHDPGWLSVGPSHTGHRRFIALRYHRAALSVIDRHGRPVFGAFRDGRLVGVAATFAAGRHPPAPHTFLRFVPACLAAGPGPIVRRPRLSSIQDRGHPDDDRVFLWFLAVDPAHQRGGVGRAAMGSAGRSSRA